MKLTTNNNNVKEKVISMSHVDEQHSCLMSIFYDGTSLSQYPLPTPDTPTQKHQDTFCTAGERWCCLLSDRGV
jgi:hypothetical protein